MGQVWLGDGLIERICAEKNYEIKKPFVRQNSLLVNRTGLSNRREDEVQLESDRDSLHLAQG